MKLIKLTVLTSLLFSTVTMFTSCEPDAEQKKTTDFQKVGIVLTGSQEAPLNSPSTALGSMDVFYTRETRLLTYTVKWSGLSGAVTGMHLHGPTPSGFGTTTIVQNIIGSGGVVSAGAAYGSIGKITANILVDGLTINEQDLLSGKYYIHIHTAAYPTDPRGEIRAQIVFQ